jgi:hypothetical protein
MDTNNAAHLLRHHTDDEDDFRFPAPALFGLVLSAIKALASLRDRFRGVGESTQLGPVAEQVIGRSTGART